MAEAAEHLLEGSGWLPEPLRTPGRPFGAVEKVVGNNEDHSAPAEHAVSDAEIHTGKSDDLEPSSSAASEHEVFADEDAEAAEGPTDGDVEISSDRATEIDEQLTGAGRRRRRTAKAAPLAAAE